MNNCMVSVIIPAYNQEKYIGECLKSLTEQKYDNIEIIIINDGSVDGTQDIVDKWASVDNRIITKRIENSGVSIARNTGIDIANGKYIMFVDSDDIIHEDLILSLVKMCESGSYDISFCGIQEFCGDNEKGDIHRFSESEDIDSKDFYNILSEKNIDILFGAPYGKLFLADIIRKNRILFEKKQSIGEDFIFNMEILKLSPRVIYTNRILYYYRLSPDSLSKKKYKSDIFVDRYKKIFDVFSDVLSINKCIKQYDNARNKLYVRIIRISIMNVLENDATSIKEKLKELEIALNHIKEYKYVVDRKNMTMKEKIVVYAFYKRQFVLLHFIIGISKYMTKLSLKKRT